MAPSTAQPTGLHRASVACAACRRAKVRCLMSRRENQCDRCHNNSLQCTFQPGRRQRASGRRRGGSTATAGVSQRHLPQEQDGLLAEGSLSSSQPNGPSPVTAQEIDLVSARDGSSPPKSPLISDRMRRHIIEALAVRRGERGSPFSFVTSGEHPDLLPSETESPPSTGLAEASAPSHAEARERSLNLATILRPLDPNAGAGSRPPEPSASKTSVTMPSYLESMSLGHTMTDVLDCGILTHVASQALFDHFLREMNAKWEFILDPLVDTHDAIRKRSSFLFATVLFCASKFAHAVDTGGTPTDAFVQSRLCGLARNLAVRTFAQGDRSIETMQAFYLLACWKEPEDGTSHLHCGYAFRILQDLDLNRPDSDDQLVRRRRTWLALYRQDIQQGLWLMRRISLASSIEDGVHFLGDPDMWRGTAHVLPFDFLSCCNANLRRFQFKIRSLVKTASSNSLPSLLDLMDAELATWRSTWQRELAKCRDSVDESPNPSLCMPHEHHVARLMALWEQSVRLSVGSEVFQRALLYIVGTNVRNRGAPPGANPQPRQSHQQASQRPLLSSVHFGLDTPSVTDVLSTDIPGLQTSIEAAFGTLRQILQFPIHDLRHAPDSVSLLAPHAALFLCLLLCLPCRGLLGPHFQHTAVELIHQVHQHFQTRTALSLQDPLSLHVAFLRSIVELVRPPEAGSRRTSPAPTSRTPPPPRDGAREGAGERSTGDAPPSAEAANGIQAFVSDEDIFPDDEFHAGPGIHEIDMQSLANLMDPHDQFGFGYNSTRDGDFDAWTSANWDGML